MTINTASLFSCLRTSLWGCAKDEETISPEVRAELKAQAVESLTALAYPDDPGLKYRLVVQFTWMVKVQDEAVQLLQHESIPVAVIKGTASGLYYPKPYLRTYGDIDLLVQPQHYIKGLQLLKSKGWVQEGKIGDSQTSMHKDGLWLELHKCPPGLDKVKEGAYILETLLSSLGDIQTGLIDQPKCVFPMLPWKQNGLELIWHFREHLYNGIGLRHAIDWMMFVNAKLHTDEAFEEIRPMLEKAGLLTLAKSVARMCQIYLGLDASIVWCADVGVDICEDLMNFILEQGNFGHKKRNDKAAKVMSRYTTPLSFLKGMQQMGLREWSLIQKYPVLQPLAWMYSLRQGSSRYLHKGGIKRFRDDKAEKSRRQEIFDQLYGGRVVSSQISKPYTIAASVLMKRIRPLYECLARSPLRGLLYYLENLYFILRYPLFGKPKMTEADRANVEQNVTFIFKSFNRQKMAKRCYRVIKAYYPKARVVIADDSEDPLQIADLAEGDLIVHLPFNSGLSKGLIAALAEVRTPYVMRMDDDELLTPASCIHDQLSFLQQHAEVDLAGIQAKHHHPERGAQTYSRIRMSKRLIIPAGTVIDGREVVYKTANVFVARSDSLREVGYDPQIYIIDHHEFFFRAAGQIVCVQDRKASIFHCHHYFAKKKEEEFRLNKLSDDTQYIASKHGPGYW